MGVGDASSAEDADQHSSERSVATLLTGTGPSWELHGPRVARRLRHRTRFCLADIHHRLHTPCCTVFLHALLMSPAHWCSATKPNLVAVRFEPIYVHMCVLLIYVC